MLFSGIPFLYYFLPLTIALYLVTPKKLKNALLLVMSLVFYAWGEPKYVLLMAVSILMCYVFGLAIGRAREKGGRRAKLWLVLSCTVSVGLLAYFKYADFFLSSFNSVTGLDVPLLKIALPIGISFYTFQMLSYTIDVYRGKAQAQRNIVSLAAYVALFPQLIAGPIVRYTDIERELRDRRTTVEGAYLGARRFIIGLGKKVLLANTFGALTAACLDQGVGSVVTWWTYAMAFVLQVYFDFSGYSDMAIGLGRIFGFSFPENFNYPFISTGITEFWRRWHMTLGSWFRDYIYIPLGGNRCSKLKQLRNILIVWALTGLWHGAAWNFVVWGLIFAVMLVVEKYWLSSVLKRLPAAVCRVYVMLIVILSFVVFNAESLTAAFTQIGGMFGAGHIPFVNSLALYELRGYAVPLVIGAVGSTPAVKLLVERVKRGRVGAKIMLVAEPVALIALLVVCTAYLVDGSFNPFLYFRF
ncbi:MAG TPA: MBOAT family protein [Eubacteriales bacterium]|nr:MBOAT family protein [Eubacteriales bacterium]